MGNLNIDTGSRERPKPPSVQSPPPTERSGTQILSDVIFQILRAMLWLGFVLAVGNSLERGPSSQYGFTAAICAAVTLVGLALCYRPQR